jgi:hypothetical protein
VAALFPAAALARPTDPTLTAKQSSAHFVVHYAPSLGDTAAQSVLVTAEQAYAAERALGFPVPLDDGDGRIDIYVDAILDRDAAGFASPDLATAQSSGYMTLDPSKGGVTYRTIAHELFHLIQFASVAQLNPLIAEATARWMELRLTGWTNRYWFLPTALDCTPCDMHTSARSPYDRWPFFAYLDDRFGPGILQQIFERAGAPGAPTTGLEPVDQALAIHGTTLAATYAAFAAQETPAQYPERRLEVGDSGSGFMSLGIDRLSAHVIQIVATGTSPRLCLSTSLTVTVRATEGDLRPALVINRTTTSLTGDGSTKTVTIPWSPCASGPGVLLVLPNGSQTTAVPYADIHADVGAALAPAPVATGGLTVSLPAKVTLLSGLEPIVWIYVTTAAAGNLFVLGAVGTQEFLFLGGGTHRIGITLPARSATRRLTFTFHAAAGKRVSSLTRVVVVRVRPPSP